MTNAQTYQPTPQKPLLLWPGVALAMLQCLAWFGVPIVMPDEVIYGPLGTVICALAIVVWWAFFSRAPRFERWGAVVLMIVALSGTWRVLHVSVVQAGIGMMFAFNAVPLLAFAFVVAVVASHRLADRPRRAVMAGVILLASGGWTLERTGGVSIVYGSDFAWRWSATPEERLLAQSNDEPLDTTRGRPAALPAAPGAAEAPRERPVARPLDSDRGGPATNLTAPAASEALVEWPGFRGANRDGFIPGVRIRIDWSKSPPVKLWRRLIGPGWSSFAVRGDLLYTQEQRGDHEIVACYKVSTGEPVGDTGTRSGFGRPTLAPARAGRRRSARAACTHSAPPGS